MTRPLLFLRSTVLLGLTSLSLPASAETTFSRLQAEALPAAEAPMWKSNQFLQADKEGRVYLLRADTLEVFQIAPSGKLTNKGHLRSASDRDDAVIRQAAMSPAGDVWALLEPPHRIRLFRGGEEKAVPSPDWAAVALAVPGGDVVAGVLPAQVEDGVPVGGAVERQDLSKPPPFLLSLEGAEWKTFVEGKPFSPENAQAGLVQALRASSAVWLAAGPKRELWAVHQNAYQLRHYSPLGKLTDEIVVGDGKIKWLERSDEDRRKLESTAGKSGFTLRRNSLGTVRHQPVVRAMALGRDGKVYLLTEVQGELALDRFDPDPTRQTLERVLLTNVEPGSMTLAAGRHALYLAALPGDGGRWRLDWELLENAEWKPVPDVTVNGQPLPPPTLPAR